MLLNDNNNEKELVALLVEGDKEAFCKLYSCKRLCGSTLY